MNDKHTHFFRIQSSTPPVIEFDPTSMSLYVRFRREKVSKTIPRTDTTGTVTVDLNASGEVIGIEAIGVEGLSIQQILDVARVEVPEVDFRQVVLARVGAAVAHST